MSLNFELNGERFPPPEDINNNPVVNSNGEQWSDPTYLRRNRHGMSLQVNELYAGAGSPDDPEFPEGVVMNRSSHGLDPEDPGKKPESSMDSMVTSKAGEAAVVSVEQEVSEAPVPNPERARDQYDRIFAAVPRPIVDRSQLDEEKVPGYDYLFEKDEAKRNQMMRARQQYDLKVDALYRGQRNYDRLVTKEAIEAAEERLISVVRRDTALASILERYSVDMAEGGDPTRQLRENSELRREVGLHLRDKEEDIINNNRGTIPERILRNQEKSPDTELLSGVERMPSRDYAAFLALSMIDGSFNYSKVVDQVEHDNAGKTLTGQHRMMANMILG